jgi:hypothetical protein
MGGDAGPLGSAEAHPHPALPRRGGGISAAPNDNICGEQYRGKVDMGKGEPCSGHAHAIPPLIGPVRRRMQVRSGRRVHPQEDRAEIGELFCE